MSKIEEFQAALNSIKDSTSNIAADLQRLADQAAGGVSTEDATAFGARLQAAADALKGVADINPEPVVEPPVTEEPPVA